MRAVALGLRLLILAAFAIYWADLSVDQVAGVLGCSPGAVKSQSARALDKLRGVLGDVTTESGAPGRPPEARHEGRDARHG